MLMMVRSLENLWRGGEGRVLLPAWLSWLTEEIVTLRGMTRPWVRHLLRNLLELLLGWLDRLKLLSLLHWPDWLHLLLGSWFLLSLGSHGGFNLFETHHFSRCRLKWQLLLLYGNGCWRWNLTGHLEWLSRWLLRSRSPQRSVGFQLRNVVWLCISFIAGFRRLGGLGKTIGFCGWLSSIEQHLLFFERARHHRGLTGKVKVFANRLLRSWFGAKSLVVEGIVGLVELVAKPIVGVFKIKTTNNKRD
jgi:hypothetical protein